MHQRVSQRGIDFLAGLWRMMAIYREKVAPVNDALMGNRTRSGAVWKNIPRHSLSIQCIAVANLAMPKAICRVRKLDRNKWLFDKTIEAWAVFKQIIHQRIPHAEGKKLVRDNPLVMPANQPPRFIENVPGWRPLLA